MACIEKRRTQTRRQNISIKNKNKGNGFGSLYCFPRFVGLRIRPFSGNSYQEPNNLKFTIDKLKKMFSYSKYIFYNKLFLEFKVHCRIIKLKTKLKSNKYTEPFDSVARSPFPNIGLVNETSSEVKNLFLMINEKTLN